MTVAPSSLSGGLVERSELPEVTHVHRGTVLHQQLSHLDNILHSRYRVGILKQNSKSWYSEIPGFEVRGYS